MDEHKRKQTDPWDDGVYGTGPTQPPKDRGGLLALLLILVISLCGLVTVMGILNVRLTYRLNQRENDSLSIAFSQESTGETSDTLLAAQASVPEETAAPRQTVTIDLKDSPESVANYTQEGGMALQDIYLKNIDSVVSISCTISGGTSSGTGVVLSRDGYVVTNAHVVEDALSISVQLTDDRVFTAELIGSDDISDLAVLSIPAEDLIPAEFGDSDKLRVGDAVTAIGDPLGAELRGTYTNGIISAINRDITSNGRTLSLIQTNAALNSGNSGGPLINCYGQVIGINTMKISAFTDKAGVEGLGFAIPSTTVKEIVDQLLAQGYVSGRPTLGLDGESVSTFYQHYYHLPAGLYITGVKSGSSAALFGILKGDILLSIDDTRITDMDSMNEVLFSHEVGDTVTVTIYRSGQKASAELILTEDRG